MRRKGVAAKEQQEELETVACFKIIQVGLNAADAQQGSEIDLEEIFGTRTGVLPIQPPGGAVGQDTPFDGAVAHNVGAREVAQHLRRRRAVVKTLAGILAAAIFAPIKRAQPAFGFEQGDTVTGALVVGQGEGACFGFRAGQQQKIGDVFAAGFAKD